MVCVIYLMLMLNVTRAPHKVFLAGAIIKANPHVVVFVLSDNVIDLLLLLSVINVD